MKARRSRHMRSASIDWSGVHRRLEQFRHAVEGLEERDPEWQEQILRERAIKLAKVPARTESAAPSSEAIEVLVFQAAGERYAFETAWVAQVQPMSAITCLPGVPDFVVGIMIVQGEVMSVIDLRLLLDLPLSKLAEPASIIVLKSDKMEFGILAEDILGTERYPAASLGHALPALADTATTYLKGVTPDRTAVLDAGLLLSDSRLLVEAA